MCVVVAALRCFALALCRRFVVGGRLFPSCDFRVVGEPANLVILALKRRNPLVERAQVLDVVDRRVLNALVVERRQCKGASGVAASKLAVRTVRSNEKPKIELAY